MTSLLMTLLLASPVHQVSGTLKRYQQWCGGVVRPNVTVPEKNGTLLFYLGDTFTGGAQVATATSDEVGHFKLSLPAGKYCVLTRPHTVKPTPAPKEKPEQLQCRLGVWSRCDSVLEVKNADLASFDLTISEPCNWQPPECY